MIVRQLVSVNTDIFANYMRRYLVAKLFGEKFYCSATSKANK